MTPLGQFLLRCTMRYFHEKHMHANKFVFILFLQNPSTYSFVASYLALLAAKSISWCLCSSSGDMPVSAIFLLILFSRSFAMFL